jgi:hypothetical protein
MEFQLVYSLQDSSPNRHHLCPHHYQSVIFRGETDLILRTRRSLD